MIEEIKWKHKWVQITNKYGKFVMHHADRFNKAYESTEYTYPLRDLIESGEYDFFVDVGAYSGYFALIASKFCKKIIAYEADPFLFGLVLYNTQFLKNIECKYAWVSNYEDKPRTSGRLAHTVGLHSRREYNIPLVSLDDELKDIKYNKMLIKLDIEGNELNALKGATELLKNPNIHWYIEIHTKAGITIEQIIEFFKERNYNLEVDTIIVRG